MSLLQSKFFGGGAALIGGIGAVSPAGGYDPVDADAIAFIAAAGITSSSQKEAVDNLCLDLKAADIWDRMVAVYPFVGGSASSHKFNLKNPADTDAAKRITWTGGLTHASTGVTSNGTTGYGNTNVNVNEDVPPYSLSVAYYSRSNTAPGAGVDQMLWGIAGGLYFDTFNTNRISLGSGHNNSGGSAVSINLTSQTNFNKLLGFSCYHFNVFKAYRGATEIGSSSTERFGYYPFESPTTVRPVYLMAWNNGGTPQLFCPRECAFFSIGYGLDATMWADLNTAVEAFQTTLGRNV